MREIEGLCLACRWLGIDQGMILTDYAEEEMETAGIRIRVLPAWKWMTGLGWE